MTTRVEDVCVFEGFRLTEHQVSDDNGIVDTYFNIRDEQGMAFGYNYDDIERPLSIIFRMWATEEKLRLSTSLF